MTTIPTFSFKVVLSTFEKMGYYVVRQKGSHVRLHHSHRKPITIPHHREIGRGLLAKLLRDSELTLDEFIKNT
ncbi:MAG: type II toxin-antitoxin system HicA family toxin [Patescibacteria group bacterium]